MVISECIWQGWKVEECEEGLSPLAVYIMLASCMAGAVLKAKWETTDIFMFSNIVCILFSVIVRPVIFLYVCAWTVSNSSQM